MAAGLLPEQGRGGRAGEGSPSNRRRRRMAASLWACRQRAEQHVAEQRLVALAYLRVLLEGQSVLADLVEIGDTRPHDAFLLGIADLEEGADQQVDAQFIDRVHLLAQVLRGLGP